jgi:AraC-like DNA-binding protein
MPFYHRKPRAPLDEFVEMLWFYEEPGMPHAQERLLPTGTVELVVNLKEDVTRIYDKRDLTKIETTSGAVVCGMHTEFFVIDTAEQQLVMGVHFRPGGVAPFLNLPADELRNSHVALEDLWGKMAAGELREKLLAAATVEEKFRVLESALFRIAFKPLEQHGAVRYALANFLHSPGAQKMAAVTGQIGLSQRRFIEVFKQKVGVTPKAFCRVMRFQQAIKTISNSAEIDWTDLALDCGYFDQSHFVHDFRAFAGMTPTEYAAKRTQHLNHVPV